MRVLFVPGRVECPLAGVGSRGSHDCVRVALDHEDTRVRVEPGRISVEDRARPPKTPIVDVVWLARARGVPFTIHLEVVAGSRGVDVDLHTHEPPDLVRDSFDFEPLDIVVNDRVLVGPEQLAAACARPSLARRISAAMTTTRDHLAGVAQDPREPGYRVVDRSIGVGALGRGMLLVRARLVSLVATNAPLIASRSLARMLREGDFELSLEALTDRKLPELVQRDLYLFELADEPLLADVRAGNLRKGDTLSFRCVRGTGELGFRGNWAPLGKALDVARAYLEFHMIGGMIARAVEA